MDSKRGDAVERILLSARKNIEEHGILGLRVADVAEQAYSSLTQIYRYFGNRDGLLARVLGDIYDEYLLRGLETLMDRLSGHEQLTTRAVVDAIPPLTSPMVVHAQGVRLQILAAAVTNEQLRDRLAEITKLNLKRWNNALDELESRLAPGEKFDRRVFTVALSMQMGYYRTLMGDDGFTDEEYHQYLVDKLTS